MAVSIVMTGTGRNCTLTSGQSTIVVSSATGLVVGATIQGTGIPTGTRIGKIVSTTVTLVNASGVEVTATASGTQSLIFSSVYGSILTISMSGSSDTATPLNIYQAGFGVMSDNVAIREIYFPGGLQVRWSNIVAGAVFDFQNWSLEFGVGGYWQFEGATILGELRGGYLVNGSQYMKTAGPTFYSNYWNNGNAGGSNMWTGTATGTVTGTFRMHNVRFVESAGNNTSFYFAAGRMNMIVENMILDHQNDLAGANASIGAAFGTLKNTFIVKANSGISATNGTNFATFDGLYYVGNYQSTPQHKFALPNNFTIDGYAPQVNSTQFVGGFSSGTTETYSNIDLSTAGWGLSDLITKYQRYGGPNTLNFPRTVSFEFNDSSAANLTNVTLYIKSGSTSLINAVQAGDYSANTQGVVLTWTTTTGIYRVCDSSVNTTSQVAQVRKYGYQEQSVAYNINLAKYSQPFFMLTESSLSGINEATAAALTTVGINWSTKTITPTADLTYDQINARIAYELALTANSAQADPRTINGNKVSLATGWTLVVNTGRTISAGTNITEWYTPTITLNGTGKITAVYQTTAGTSTVLELNTPSDGYSLCIFKADGTTKYFASNVVMGAYYVYFAPSEAGTYYLGAENYGQKRTADTLVLSGGNVWYNITDQEDVGITDTKTNVAAYTTLSTTSQIYDATAYFRLSETGIKLGQLCTRDGLYLDFGTYNVKIKDDASAIVGVASGTITYKSIVINETTKYNAMKATPPKTITPTDTEIINVLIEDANGDSKLSILGGDNLGYELWKVTTATATDDYATGTLLTTLPNNSNPYRFIGLSGFDIVGRDISSGVRRRSSMLKGTYEQAFYVGNQIQLATDAPQLLETIDKLDELIIKIDTDLDVPVSTRATLAQIEASTILAKEATSQDIKTKVDTLTNYDDTTTQNKLDSIQNTVDNISIDFTPVLNAVDALPTLSEIEAGKVGEIKTKVDTLENYDDTIAIAKLTNIQQTVNPLPTLAEIEAGKVGEITAVKAKTDELNTDRLKNVATVETTGDQIQAFKS